MSETLPSSQSEMTAEERLAKMEIFIARRFDEISMEINATSQMIDMAEEGASKRFQDMLGTLHAITFSGSGNTPANSGAELESVIGEAEEAVTRIMDAADRIASRTGSITDESAKNAIDADVQEILMACEFQDLTGQRIRKALETIRNIEERLSSTLASFGIQIEQKIEDTSNASKSKTSDDFIPDDAISQDSIDSLFD